MHDGAPSHKGREVTRFLDDHGIEVLPWPGNSPAMNPIDNLWAILKSQTKKKTITNKQELIEELSLDMQYQYGRTLQ